MASIRRSELDNGVVILSQRIPGQVLSCGLWFREGSAAEEGFPGGITHVLEHMNFKGTPTRSAFAISAAIEGRGGMINAATGRCDTGFYTTTLQHDWREALAVLADICLSSVHDNGELRKELSVIRDEIRMISESPEDELGDLVFAELYPDNPFGQPIQGDEDSVGRITRETLLRFVARFVRGANLVVVLVGDLEHGELEREAAALFGGLERGKDPFRPRLTRLGRGRYLNERAAALQTHIDLALNGPDYGSPDYRRLALLNTLLGEGMSSRLFQELREEHALCYTVYSWLDVHQRVTTFGAYLACDAARAEEAVERVRGQLKQLCTTGPSGDELERTRHQLLGGLAIANEQSMNRMMRLARREIAGLPPRDDDAIIAEIGAVTREDLVECARQWLDGDGLCETLIVAPEET
jgi:predicted Zn-dependent peptidase